MRANGHRHAQRNAIERAWERGVKSTWQCACLMMVIGTGFGFFPRDAFAGLGTVEAPPKAVIERDSLSTETPRQAWLGPGFRLGIGFAYNGMMGVDKSPNWGAYEVWIEPQYRIDPRWALGLGLAYGFAQGNVTGISWRVMADTTYQPIRGVMLQLGLGLAGLNIQRRNVPSLVVPNTDVASSGDGNTTPAIPSTYTSTDDRVILKDCDGTGVAARAGLGYAFVVAGYFSTGPTVQLYGQWVRCGQGVTGDADTDPVTGRPLEIRQWWKQWGWSAGWMFSWR